MIRIRPAVSADAQSIARIRAESWRMIYANVLPEQTLAEMTTPEAIAREGEWRAAHPMDGVLIAEAPGEPDADPSGLVGFAAFGPERSEDDQPYQPLPGPDDVGRAELYAIYVIPRRWSTGVGRALLEEVLTLAASVGYTDISLWVLEANAQARRFYELAGFRRTGESLILNRLGGVTELRYRRMVG
jgi:GNAT superfamily N-acetyltransferase